MEEPKACIIVPAWNRGQITKECIASVKKYTNYSNYEIILINNGSDKENTEILESIKGIHTYFKTTKNRGCGGGFNMGLRQGILDGCDYFVLLSNDNIVEKNWLTNMIKCQQETKAGIVAPVTDNTSIPEQMISTYGFKKPNRFIKLPRYHVIFMCVLLTREVVKRVGYCDELFFPGNYEDNDYCQRARLAGFTIFVDGYTFIIHKEGPREYAYNEVLRQNLKKYLKKWKEEEIL